ncbi:hypothetical protein AQ810_00230 [Burkholderia pseudomallei]|nr:hypothetical protein AQ810_00230 [Burkholderia pseudomallei]
MPGERVGLARNADAGGGRIAEHEQPQRRPGAVGAAARAVGFGEARRGVTRLTWRPCASSNGPSAAVAKWYPIWRSMVTGVEIESVRS